MTIAVHTNILKTVMLQGNLDYRISCALLYYLIISNLVFNLHTWVSQMSLRYDTNSSWLYGCYLCMNIKPLRRLIQHGKYEWDDVRVWRLEVKLMSLMYLTSEIRFGFLMRSMLKQLPLRTAGKICYLEILLFWC